MTHNARTRLAGSWIFERCVCVMYEQVKKALNYIQNYDQHFQRSAHKKAHLECLLQFGFGMAVSFSIASNVRTFFSESICLYLTAYYTLANAHVHTWMANRWDLHLIWQENGSFLKVVLITTLSNGFVLSSITFIWKSRSWWFEHILHFRNKHKKSHSIQVRTHT